MGRLRAGICAFFVLTALAMGASNANAQRVLFVGNSLTGYNDMPALFSHLGASTGHKPYVEEYIWYGHTLKAQESTKALQGALTTQKWDYVVIQEFSTLPLTKPAEFDQSVTDYDKLAKAAGARTVLLENWALEGQPTYAKIIAAYTAANQPVGALLVPLASAWDTVNTHSALKLYRDGKHPTPIATYMAACMLYAEIYKSSPVGLVHDGIDIIPAYPGGTYGGVPQSRKFVDLDGAVGADAVKYVQSVAAGLVPPPVPVE